MHRGEVALSGMAEWDGGIRLGGPVMASGRQHAPSVNPADPESNPPSAPDHAPHDLPLNETIETPDPGSEGPPTDQPAPTNPLGPPEPVERMASAIPFGGLHAIH